MSLTPANVSMLLALLSSIAPGTLAVVAGILGAAIGYFGKRYLKQNDCPTCSRNSQPSAEIPRSDSTRRAASPRTRKKGAATGSR